ncbi:MAG: class I tRNA ligase family protein [Candidatus Pacebacteria bacterium]|nr:class I tRNA ligase family protein [Candidatus Paceibacterota bacterium]MBP9866781.1 class I tRNA ligase family protein [Candidatus Paceibacterota bacterium]
MHFKKYHPKNKVVPRPNIVLGKEIKFFSVGDFYFTKKQIMSNNQTNTPKTISEKEQETLKFWQENAIFEKTITTPANEEARGDFSFYDGPPFATGLPHYGHILAGTIKDTIPRYQTMKGNSVRRVWGWDCHGLPIENLIEKKLGLTSKKDIEDFGIDKFNKDANDSVLTYEEEWKKVVPRLGRWADMDRPYKTMDATYTESIWWAWKHLHEKGLVYEGHKMMHICPRCETTLAQSEVGMEYTDITDLSVTAKFELVDEPGTFVLAWTTTPWTLPGNSALAVKGDASYVVVDIDGMEGKYILAEERVEHVLKDMKCEVVKKMKGEDLVGKKYIPPFPYFKDSDIEYKENAFKIWHADFITLDTGTGIAHEAPAFGAEDMDLAKLHSIPVIKHVKMDGTFISTVTDFAGIKVKAKDDTQSADIEIIKWLAHHNVLFEKHKIIHSYPLCWRCKTPLLNYATSSWFVDVPKIKDKLLSENQKIGWTPAHTRDGRFGKWLEGAREWAVSRSRYWGAPLPVWKNDDGEAMMIGSLKELAEHTSQKPKNTYYIMRHGESVSNQDGILETKGDPNNHLTEKGKAQVMDSLALIKSLGIDVIITSPFVRTRETAAIVSSFLDIPVETEDRIHEYDMGEFSGKKATEYMEYYGHSYLRFNTRPKGGETHEEMMNRSMSAIMDFENRYEGKNILVVTHGGPARMMLIGGELYTEEEALLDERAVITTLYLGNAEIRKLNLKIVPRDETGAVNLHRPYIDNVTLSVNDKIYTRILDVFDCWFESGSMPFASIHYPFENKKIFDKNYPADFIAEGVDQTRGWFYSLINLGVGLFDKAPYKHVIVNGHILASSGLKLSKSEKNYTDPMELVEKYGADAMRYALIASPAVKGENVQFDDENVSEIYKKCISRLENVVTLYEMNKPEKTQPLNTSENILDSWMISRINELVTESTKGYEEYMLEDATRGIAEIIDDISVWYTRRSRDRLKGDEGEMSKKEAYQTLKYTLLTLSKVMAPVMPFISERIYKQCDGEKESVHLESWPISDNIDYEIIKDMKIVRELVSLGLMKRTETKINVKQPLLSVSFKKVVSGKYNNLIKDELNVKDVFYNDSQKEDVVLDTTITEELQKEGDIRKLIRAVQDMRKAKGLKQVDEINLVVSSLTSLGDMSLLVSTCKIKEIKEDVSIKDNSIELSSGVLCFVLE